MKTSLNIRMLFESENSSLSENYDCFDFESFNKIYIILGLYREEKYTYRNKTGGIEKKTKQLLGIAKFGDQKVEK